MLGTASELIFSLAASWCLLADGLPFYGSLILVSIFVPCLNFYFKLTMGFFGTLERGFTNAEVWRCQWAQGLQIGLWGSSAKGSLGPMFLAQKLSGYA
jgi:hypothetical protein